MKKLLCNTLIIIIMLGVFCNGYFGFSGLSFSDRVSYAEADNWTDCDTSDLVTAFRYYCKSRNLALEGSIADALTSFTTNTFNNICSTLGIDPTQLQAELKKTTNGNLGLRFLFSQTGIIAYNRIFAEFLQNNDLNVGDEVENKNLKSDYFYDGAFVYVVSGYSDQTTRNTVVKYGTKYKYSGLDIYNLNGSSVNVGNVTNISTGYSTNWSSRIYKGQAATIQGYFIYNNGSSGTFNGEVCLIKLTSSNDIYVGMYHTFVSNGTADNGNRYYNIRKFGNTPLHTLTDNDLADIYITTNNNTINNNSYNYNYTIIYNDGDHYGTDDEEPLPDTPPGGGGGDDPVDPDPDDPIDPYDPTKPFPDTPDNPTPDPGVHGSPGSDGTITIPDFNFDLPDINWSLDGLQHKFPFSLPFDLYNACKLLNAEPQTPELDYTVDLVVYQWPIQMDLHWLDPAARVIRIFELLAFVVGLILITRHLIGG